MKFFLSKIGFASLLVLLMLFSAYPYIFYCFINLPSIDVMIIIFLGIFSLYGLFLVRKSKHSVPNIGPLMIIQVFIWLCFSIIHQDTSYLVRVLLIIETYLALYVLFSEKQIFKFANVYNWSLTIQGACGVIAFFLFFGGLIEPVATYYFNDVRYEQCFILTCSNTVAANFMRVGGYFDEPGALAFWGVFALLINKLTYNFKKVEYILLISLLFTFSAAYFIIIPIYLLLFYHKKIKNFAIIIVFAIPLAYATYNYISDNESVALYTVQRFEGGRIESTRYEQTELARKLFLHSPIVGNGAKEISDKYREAEENPYEILAKDGLIGLFITYLPLLFVAMRYRKDRYAIFSVIVLVIDYLQRPFHVNQMHFFMLYLFCSIVILRNQNTINTRLQHYGTI